MAIEQDEVATRQARLDKMLAEFRAAQVRRQLKQAVALENQSVAGREKAVIQAEVPPVLIEH